MVRVKAKLDRTDRINVILTRVFAATRTGGNPCPVVPVADGLTFREMKRLATRFGLDTAFVLKARSKTSALRIRYFVPDHEMGISGHATVAAVTIAVRTKRLKPGRVRIETRSGAFDVESAGGPGHMLVTLEQNPPVFDQIVPPETVARVLNVSRDDICRAEGPVQAVSVSRAKLLVPLRDWKVLNRLEPDFEALWRLCDRLGVTGLYPFTRRTDKPNASAEARQFPLRAGFPEDAATGVAAAALGAYLANHDLAFRSGLHTFRIAQGYAMGAPSVIETIAECAGARVTRTAIRGAAIVVRHERVALA